MSQSEKRIEILKVLGYNTDFENHPGAWRMPPDPFTDLNAAFECVAKAREWGGWVEISNHITENRYTARFWSSKDNYTRTITYDSNPATAIAEAFWKLLQERKQ